ncbi:exocyst complex component 5, putative [Acanthamoeba castellanii str. Neff]|uniref:Exocyst complex component 5, putative n=1 Tax=Acanthamoeba castellanii (strain ATCC 30010 / Neff) TaxID=1257118 RepID=L8GKK3_ACACF|nr:exocyst complex component 5, putative [Acanthamoeba castellanii str. Neff]ELR13552.1 exocyst complex component 5, putative [Acanthamoeba castellanii str. Neff]
MDRADINRFQGANFDAHDYVDIVSRKLVYQLTRQQQKQNESDESQHKSSRSPTTGDGRKTQRPEFFATEPFLDLFDNTIADLKYLREQVETKISKSMEDCAKEEEVYKSKIWEQNRTFQGNLNSFKELDARISGVGNIAVRIGDRLEAVEKQRTAASEAKELINYFIELCSGEIKSSIFLDKKQLRERAKLLKKLSVFTKELERAEEEMSHMKAERDRTRTRSVVDVPLPQESVLKDPVVVVEGLVRRTKQECADILYQFNGGSSCVKRYISLLKMFFDTESLEMDEALADQGTYTARVQDLDNVELASARINEFYDDIITSCQKEYKVITRVFPNPPAVMRELAQRIFEQRISMFLERMLQHTGAADSVLTYLRLMATAYGKTIQLVNVLQEYKTDLDFAAMVDSLLLNYTDNYIDNELQCLVMLYTKELENLRREAETTSASAKQGFTFDKMFEASKDFASAWSVQGKKNANLMYRVPELTTLEPILHFIHLNEESVRRCIKLSKPGALPPNLFRVFGALVDYLGHQYLNPALEAALKPLRGGRSGRVHFLEVAQQVNQIVILLQRHFHVEIAPHVSQSNTVYSECIDKKDHLLAMLEDKISEGLELTLNLVVATLERQLGYEQGRNDFRLSDDDIISINRPTTACANAVNYIVAQTKVIQANLDGKNAESFLEELGLRLQKLLLEHFRKFTVSQGMGGMKLKRDMQEYQQAALSSFPFPAVTEAFEVLSDLASIHLIEAGQLRHLLDESALASLKRVQVVEYVKLRSDFKPSWIQQYRLLDEKKTSSASASSSL